MKQSRWNNADFAAGSLESGKSRGRLARSPTISSFGMQDLAAERARVRRPTNVIHILNVCAKPLVLAVDSLGAFHTTSANTSADKLFSASISDRSRCWLHLSIFLSLTSRRRNTNRYIDSALPGRGNRGCISFILFVSFNRILVSRYAPRYISSFSLRYRAPSP